MQKLRHIGVNLFDDLNHFTRTILECANHLLLTQLAMGDVLANFLFGIPDHVAVRGINRLDVERKQTPQRIHVLSEVAGIVGYDGRTRAKHYIATPAPGRPQNDLGWEIYPEGLYRLLKRYSTSGWPLFVTENGVADARGDERPDFLRAHIYAMDRARSEGVNVIGYLYWSLTDNFEWAEGYAPRFGLYAVDYATQTRTLRPSGEVYARIAQSRRLP